MRPVCVTVNLPQYLLSLTYAAQVLLSTLSANSLISFSQKMFYFYNKHAPAFFLKNNFCFLKVILHYLMFFLKIFYLFF